MRLSLLVAVLLASGCATMRAPRVSETLAEQALSRRESLLFEQTSFALGGRIGISNGKDAGSGQFRWQQQGAAFDFTLTVTLTGDRLRLHGQPGKVILVESNGTQISGPDAEQLLFARTGWRIPVTELGYWVRAMRAPGSLVEPEFAADGQLRRLSQRGWEIDYKRWDVQDPPLPLMLVASRGADRVRVRISTWE